MFFTPCEQCSSNEDLMLARVKLVTGIEAFCLVWMYPAWDFVIKAASPWVNISVYDSADLDIVL